MNQYKQHNDLITGLRNSEAEAIRYLYNLHYRSLCYYAERLTHSKEEAEDIAVDCFIKLLNKKDDFDNLTDIKAFLYTATRNACFDYYRKEKRHDSSHREILYMAQPSDAGDDFEMINAEIMQELSLAIENLPPQCSKVFKLIFFKGLNTAEVAGQMNINPKTVLNQKAKAVQLLRHALLKKGLLATGLLLNIILQNSFRN